MSLFKTLRQLSYVSDSIEREEGKYELKNSLKFGKLQFSICKSQLENVAGD